MTLNKKVSIWIGILAVVIPVAVAVAQSAGNRAYAPKETAPTLSANSTTPKTPNRYTLAQVSAHNDQTSCWSVVNGGVYDLTSWINQHPGGPEAILGICGKDGSAAFNAQHGGQKKPANELAGFEIGTLIQ